MPKKKRKKKGGSKEKMEMTRGSSGDASGNSADKAMKKMMGGY